MGEVTFERISAVGVSSEGVASQRGSRELEHPPHRQGADVMPRSVFAECDDDGATFARHSEFMTMDT
jgi:hypothetical protein